MLIEIDVKRPVAIPGEKSRVVDLRPGIASIDDSLLDHWFVKGLLNDGSICILERKKHNFKSLDQIEEEKKKKKEAVKEEEKETVIFASHQTMDPIGTVLDKKEKEEKKEEVVVVKKTKVPVNEPPKVVRRKKG
jgi:hypothetical protein